MTTNEELAKKIEILNENVLLLIKKVHNTGIPSDSSEGYRTRLRPKEASAKYNIGLSTLWLWIKEGKIPKYKLSNRVTVIDTVDLEAFINGK